MFVHALFSEVLPGFARALPAGHLPLEHLPWAAGLPGWTSNTLKGSPAGTAARLIARGACIALETRQWAKANLERNGASASEGWEAG